jgi:hypothetical protein
MAKRIQSETKWDPKPRGGAKGSGLQLGGIPRVNLLPAVELQRRAASALIRRWVAGLAATAVVVSGLVAAAYWERGIAEQRLLAEQTRTAELGQELTSLAHVSQAVADRSTLSELRTAAMGNDLEWRALFADLTRTLPRGTELIGFELVTGANSAAETDPATEIGMVGRLTVSTPDPADQNRMVDKLRALDIALSADAGSLIFASDGKYTFVVEFVVNQTHYSHDYLPEAGA